jgi:hypothetical protein
MTHVADKPSLNKSSSKYSYMMARNSTLNNMVPDGLLLSRRIHIQTKYFITALYKWRTGLFCCMIHAVIRGTTEATPRGQAGRHALREWLGMPAQQRRLVFVTLQNEIQSTKLQLRHTNCGDWSVCEIWGSYGGDYDHNVMWLLAAWLINTNVSQ